MVASLRSTFNRLLGSDPLAIDAFVEVSVGIPGRIKARVLAGLEPLPAELLLKPWIPDWWEEIRWPEAEELVRR